MSLRIMRRGENEARPARPCVDVMESPTLIQASSRAAGAPTSIGNGDSGRVLELQGHVKHYAWGDPGFIPKLLQVDQAGGQPWAELWMGAHADGPSIVALEGETTTLDQLIKADPARILHPAVAARFGQQLPFLFKVLAAASPLSVQAHPTREHA